MRNIVWSMVAFGVSVMAVSNLANAASVVAKSDGVPVYESASKTSKVVMTLKKDQELPCGERKGLFWEVEVSGGKKAFVFLSAVSRNAESNSTNLAKALRSATKESRQDGDEGSSRARTSVMGVRGLDESSTVANAGDTRPNLRMVYDMEDRTVSEKKVKQLAKLVSAELESKIK